MWFGTQDGLNRFDGTKYIVFNSNNFDKSRAIIGSDVYDLAIDSSESNLWVLTAYGGLSKIEIRSGKVKEVYPLNNLMNTSQSLWLKCMFVKSNYIFIGSDEGLVICFNTITGKVENYFDCVNSYKIKGSVDKIYVDNRDRIWLFITGFTVIVTDRSGKKLKKISLSNRFDHITDPLKFNDYAATGTHILAATSRGIIPLSIDRTSVDTTILSWKYLTNTTANNNWNAISWAGDTVITVGSKGLYNILLSQLQYQRLLISRVYEDKDWILLTESIFRNKNTVWLGSQYGAGCIKNINTPFSGFYSSMDGSNLKIQHANTLAPYSDSSILVCSDNGLHLVNMNQGQIKPVFNNDIYYSAFKGPNDYIIGSGVYTGIHLANQNGKEVLLESVFPELSVIQRDLLISSIKFNDTLYLLASQNKRGLYLWNTERRSVSIINDSTKPVSLKNNIINRLYLDHLNNVCIVGDNYLSIFQPNSNTIQHINLVNPIDHKQLSINMDVCELNNKYWLATYGWGIIRLSNKYQIEKIYSIKDGLNNTGVYKIFPLNDKNIIVSSNNGLSVLNVETSKIYNYFEEDGLQSSSFEETSGCITKDFICLGGISGFTKIDPVKLKINAKSPLFYFTSIQVDKAANNTIVKTEISDLTIKSYTIPNTWLQTNISFVGLNYTNPNRVTYQYRIIERDTSWIDLGTQNFVNLIGLAPGTYTLEVKAANEDGYWSPVKQLILTFEPKWYQTWLFYTLLTITIAAILYAFFRYRINQIRKQHQIRKDIASDLHDDIGSSLNTVKIFTHLAKKEQDKEPYLNEIESSLTSATTGLRDMLWVLEDSQDTAFELVERIRKFALPVLEANNIRLDTRIEAGEHKALSKAEKKNLYLIAKESINNSIKYADCKNIFLHVHQANGKIVVSIQDDGKGFDTDKQFEGNGLKNIRERARQIHYTIEISSRPQMGTLVKVVKK